MFYDMEEDLAQTRHELANLKRVHDKLKLECAYVDEQYQELEKEVKKYKSIISELNEKNAASTVKEAHLCAELISCQTKLKTIELEMAEHLKFSHDCYQICENQCKELTEEVNAQRKKLVCLENELQQQLDINHQYMLSNDTLRNENEKLLEGEKKLEEQAKFLKEEVKDLTNQLQYCQCRISELTVTLENQQSPPLISSTPTHLNPCRKLDFSPNSTDEKISWGVPLDIDILLGEKQRLQNELTEAVTKYRKEKENKITVLRKFHSYKQKRKRNDDQSVGIRVSFHDKPASLKRNGFGHAIGTANIATQTDRIAIIAVAVQTVDQDNDSEDSSTSDVEDRLETISEEIGDFTGSFSAQAYDLDLYRSCRKLSVLLEEDTEDLHRNPSFKKSTKLSQSADDVTHLRRSTTIITVTSLQNILQSQPPTITVDEDDDNSSKPPSSTSSSSSDLQLPLLLDPADALRQPHSFDSYLDPTQVQNTTLPRQISDPTQNTAFTPALIRRGSYIKRPRSTCRPLTLPCNRVPKVRFDLTEREGDVVEKKEVIVSSLKPVSRFSVTRVDESELSGDVRRQPTLANTCLENQDEDSPDFVEHGTLDDIYPCKRRKQSDVSLASSEGDIVIKSLKYHISGGCILMRDLSGDSTENDIPYIDAEEAQHLCLSLGSSQTTQTDLTCIDNLMYTIAQSPTSDSSSGTYCTAAGDLTPLTDEPPKLSKSPTVLKDLSSFDSPEKKHCLNDIVDEEEEDISEASDTITYVTVKSDVVVTSDSDTYVTLPLDSDSDTYVTLKSEHSYLLERKYSDLSENSGSPYNTPPDTSSASFCTPPDNFSPLLRKIRKYEYLRSCSGRSTPTTRSSSPLPANVPVRDDSVVESIQPSIREPQVADCNCESFQSTAILFESPKLEFYETNDSVENLESFLETEEGLRDDDSKRNSLESPTDTKLVERRTKRHPLSRQNSTEEYIYLEPQDSSLNLSEEISSPSTTPETSNKTVILKNNPLTVSNTIDLDDDDFPISESDVVSVEVMHTCKSEPCIPSMGDSPLSRLGRQSCSMSDEPESPDSPSPRVRRSLPEDSYPAIIISAVSSESDESDLGLPLDPKASCFNF